MSYVQTSGTSLPCRKRFLAKGGPSNMDLLSAALCALSKNSTESSGKQVRKRPAGSHGASAWWLQVVGSDVRSTMRPNLNSQ